MTRIGVMAAGILSDAGRFWPYATVTALAPTSANHSAEAANHDRRFFIASMLVSSGCARSAVAAHFQFVDATSAGVRLRRNCTNPCSAELLPQPSRAVEVRRATVARDDHTVLRGGGLWAHQFIIHIAYHRLDVAFQRVTEAPTSW